jgi:hypothetical protein
VVSAVLVASCADQPTAPGAGDPPGDITPNLDILDARNGGNAGFYWLSPMISGAPPRGAARARDLAPVVEVCIRDRDAADGCAEGAPLIATFSRDDTGSDRLRVGFAGNYTAVWAMNDHPVERNEIYRIRVLLSGAEIGFADVIALQPREVWRYRSPEDDTLRPISEQGAFPIRFRLLEGVFDQAFCDEDGDGDYEDCDAAVEIPGDGEDTVVDLIAEDPVTGETIVAAVVTAPDGVFVDDQGTPIAEVVLSAEVEIVPPSEDVFTNDNLEFPFFIEINTTPENVQIASGSGVTVVICQDTNALEARNVTDQLHPQFIAYKVTKPSAAFPDGQTLRLETTIGAPECLGGQPIQAPVQGTASLLRRGAAGLLGLFGPEPVSAFRGHGGLNTIVRTSSAGSGPFSTFGATLGPNADATSAVVPDGVIGEPTTIEIQVRSALGDDFDLGGDTLSVVVTSGPNTGATVTVMDNADGTYTAEYTPTAPGTDEISITIRTFDGVSLGQIGGSPYSSVIAPPVATFTIDAILPSTAAAGAGQRITIEGSDFPAGAIVEFAQGQTVLNGSVDQFSTPQSLLVEFPTTGLTAGVDAQVTVRDGSGGASNSVTLPITTVPATPIVIELVEGPWNPITPCAGLEVVTDGILSLNSSGSIRLRAYGLDNTGAELQIVQGGNTWTLPIGCTTWPPVSVIAPLPDLGAAGDTGGTLAEGAAQVRVRTSVNSVPSAWSDPIDVTLDVPPQITNVLPGSGVFGAGQMITLQGSGFPTNANPLPAGTVQFTQGGGGQPINGIAFPITSTEMLVRTEGIGLASAGAGGIGSEVVVFDGSSASNAFPLGVVDNLVAPQIIQVSAAVYNGTSSCTAPFFTDNNDRYVIQEERWVIAVQAHGFETGGASIEITQNQGGTDYIWTVPFECATNSPILTAVPLPFVNANGDGGDLDDTGSVWLAPGPASFRVRAGANGDWTLPYAISFEDQVCNIVICQ